MLRPFGNQEPSWSLATRRCIICRVWPPSSHLSCISKANPVRSLQLQRGKDLSLEPRDISRAMDKLFGDAHYLDFNLDEGIEAERDTQRNIFDSLQKNAKSPKLTTAGKAYFQLAIAYSIGYGTKANRSGMLDAALKSAQRGYLPAQAVIAA